MTIMTGAARSPSTAITQIMMGLSSLPQQRVLKISEQHSLQSQLGQEQQSSQSMLGHLHKSVQSNLGQEHETLPEKRQRQQRMSRMRAKAPSGIATTTAIMT